jgi:RimJ/RimL family protein N-acetyltransferase
MMSSSVLAAGDSVLIRKIEPDDFEVVSQFEYSVSVTEPHGDRERVAELHAQSGFWQDETGAVGIVGLSSNRLLGTLQYYRCAPCIHGLEIGYVVHDPKDRRHGYVAQGLRLLSDLLFADRPQFYRQQLVIGVWNTPSWKVAERCGFLRERVMRSCGFGQGDPDDMLHVFAHPQGLRPGKKGPAGPRLDRQ